MEETHEDLLVGDRLPARVTGDYGEDHRVLGTVSTGRVLLRSGQLDYPGTCLSVLDDLGPLAAGPGIGRLTVPVHHSNLQGGGAKGEWSLLVSVVGPSPDFVQQAETANLSGGQLGRESSELLQAAAQPGHGLRGTVLSCHILLLLLLLPDHRQLLQLFGRPGVEFLWILDGWPGPLYIVTVLYTVLGGTILYIVTVLYCTVLYCTSGLYTIHSALYRSEQQGTVLYCVLYCTVLYCVL